MIILFGFCMICLIVTGDLLSLHGVGPFPSFLLGTFRLAATEVLAVVVTCNLRGVFDGGVAEAALSELLSSSLSHDNVSSSVYHMIRSTWK